MRINQQGIQQCENKGWRQVEGGLSDEPRLFEPLVMFFGLTNIPAMFQKMMHNIFQELIDEGVVVIYMHDILIFSGQTKEEHHAIIVWVLDILHKHQLYLKAKKCTFGQPTVEYLRLIFSEGRVEMDPVKVAGVHDWPTLRNVTKVQSFVRLINFYQRLIQDFLHMAKPLHQLTKKGEHGNGPKTNGRPSKNSNGSSP